MTSAGAQPARDARACILCGVPLVSLYPEVVDPQSAERFAVLSCPQCGLGHTDPVPEDLSRYYGDVYYGEGRHPLTARSRAWRRASFLDRHVERRGLVVDVGCGGGDFLRAARRRGWRVAGTELPDPAHRLARAGIEVRSSLGEMRDLAPVDAITLWHSLEHFPDPAAQLVHAHDLLGDDGRLIVAVPDLGGMQARLVGRFGFHLDVPRHLLHFDEGALARLLEQSGFEIERVRHQEFEYELFGWLQSWLNALVSPPNALFTWLVGRPSHRSTMQLLVSIVLGTLLLPFALVATVAARLLGRGATLEVVARKRSAARVASGRHAATP